MIHAFDYRRGLPESEGPILEAVQRVLHSGVLLFGEETEAFEREFADYVGARHCIAVSSGTAALHLALAGSGVVLGDEVITVANTCVPTVAAIRLAGAIPVFVDVDGSSKLMDPQAVVSALTPRTTCILPVHLWGHVAAMDEIRSIADTHGVRLIEDCAQAHGAFLNGRHVGTSGIAGCFSFYPTKNLSAYGDAGAVVTNDDTMADHCRMLRMYGYDDRRRAVSEGFNYRIAEIEAAVLRVGLRDLDGNVSRRRHLAQIYDRRLSPSFGRPVPTEGSAPCYHQYVVLCEDRAHVETVLTREHIGFGVHYPTPVHQMPAYRRFLLPESKLLHTEHTCGRVLSLPIHPYLRDSEVLQVCGILNAHT